MGVRMGTWSHSVMLWGIVSHLRLQQGSTRTSINSCPSCWHQQPLVTLLSVLFSPDTSGTGDITLTVLSLPSLLPPHAANLLFSLISAHPGSPEDGAGVSEDQGPFLPI